LSKKAENEKEEFTDFHKSGTCIRLYETQKSRFVTEI